MIAPYYEAPGVTLYCGDCLQLLPDLDAFSCAVVTDPPYGIRLTNNDRDGHRRREAYGVRGDESADVGMRVLEWARCMDVPTVTFASPWQPWPGDWRNLIAWDKGGAVGGGGDIRTCLKRTWELIQVTRTGKMVGAREESVWRYPVVPADTVIHICAKPVPLMAALMRQFIDPTLPILDPFMGSGTTGVAAVRLGRKFIGIELSEAYCEIAAKRIQRELEQPQMFSAAELEPSPTTLELAL